MMKDSTLTIRFSRRIVAVGLALLFLLGACVQGEAEARPPDIRYGQDMCADCGMVISDPRFASAAAYEIEPGRYKSLSFDDMGDMVQHIKQNPDLKFTDFWAHDYRHEEWIDATTAHYVVSPRIMSPMMHGVAAFTSQQDADALAAELDAEVLDWNHMRATILTHDH